MLEKINQVHGKGGIYLPSKNNYETQFGVQHFAGVVYYDAAGIFKTSSLLARFVFSLNLNIGNLLSEASLKRTVTHLARIWSSWLRPPPTSYLKKCLVKTHLAALQKAAPTPKWSSHQRAWPCGSVLVFSSNFYVAPIPFTV